MSPAAQGVIPGSEPVGVAVRLHSALCVTLGSPGSLPPLGTINASACTSTGSHTWAAACAGAAGSLHGRDPPQWQHCAGFHQSCRCAFWGQQHRGCAGSPIRRTQAQGVQRAQHAQQGSNAVHAEPFPQTGNTARRWALGDAGMRGAGTPRWLAPAATCVLVSGLCLLFLWLSAGPGGFGQPLALSGPYGRRGAPKFPCSATNQRLVAFMQQAARQVGLCAGCSCGSSSPGDRTKAAADLGGPAAL